MEAEEAYTRARMGVETYAAWGPNDLRFEYRYTDTAQTTLQLRFLNIGLDPIDDCDLYVNFRQFGKWHTKVWNLGPLGIGVTVSQRCAIGTHDAAYAILKATDGSETQSSIFLIEKK